MRLPLPACHPSRRTGSCWRPRGGAWPMCMCWVACRCRHGWPRAWRAAGGWCISTSSTRWDTGAALWCFHGVCGCEGVEGWGLVVGLVAMVHRRSRWPRASRACPLPLPVGNDWVGYQAPPTGVMGGAASGVAIGFAPIWLRRPELRFAAKQRPYSPSATVFMTVHSGQGAGQHTCALQPHSTGPERDDGSNIPAACSHPAKQPRLAGLPAVCYSPGESGGAV
jgi:hypothetical protein